MEEESDLLYKKFLNSKSLFEEEEGDDEDDPDYNLDKDLQNFDLDNDFNIEDYLNFMNDPNFSENIQISNSEELILDETNEKSQCTAEQLFVIQQQMKFHVQTLTQTWMLTTYSPLLETINSESKKLLDEFDTVLQSVPQLSRTINGGNFAQNALKLIENRGREIKEAETRYSFAMVSDLTRKIITENRDIFVFDWAFPEKRLFVSQVSSVFSLAEDFLIASALNEHPKSIRVRTHFCQKIHQKYMPYKSLHAISSHIKHYKRFQKKMIKSKLSEDQINNPITYFYNHSKLPSVISCFIQPDSDTYFNYRQSPKWFKRMNFEIKHPIDRSVDNKGNTKKARFIVPKFDNTVLQNAYGQGFQNIPVISSFSFQSIDIVEPVSEIESTLKYLKSHKLEKKKRTFKEISSVKNKKLRDNTTCHPHEKQNLGLTPSVETSEQNEQSSLPINSFSDIFTDVESNIDLTKVKVSDEVVQEESVTKVSSCKSPVLNYFEAEEHEEVEIVPIDSEEFLEDDELGEEEDYIADEESELISSDKISIEEELEEEPKFNSRDDENDLMALMEASWTAVSNRSRQNQQVNEGENSINCIKPILRKSDIIALQRNSSMFILQKALLYDQSSEEDLQEWLIHYYFKKAQKIFLPQEYYQFLQLLVNLLNKNIKSSDSENYNSNIDPSVSSQKVKTSQHKKVYEKIKKFLLSLRSSYLNKGTEDNYIQTINGIQELIELLVLFLDSRQAHIHGESFSFLYWKRVFDFLRKVEHYLTFIYSKRSQQQGCLQRLIKSLNQINQNALLGKINQKETKSKVKSIVSKILNGNNLLIEEFSSLFLDDSPMSYYYSNPEDFDEFSLTNEQVNCDLENNLETVHISNNEKDLKYGTSQCPCECHSSKTNSPAQCQHGLFKHCSSCAIRFIGGRIYLPHYNSCTKKVQLIEYVKNDDNDPMKESLEHSKQCSKSEHSVDNHLTQNVSSNSSQTEIPPPEWTIAEDRMLLEACRSIILDLQITQLTEEVFESVARQLVEQVEPRRSTKQLCERLRQLIEMLTSSNKSVPLGTNS